MQIAPVSFAGKKEIQSIARNAGQLNTAQKELVKNACAFHDLEVDITSDGEFLADPKQAEVTSSKLMDSLDKAGASKFSYLIAVDALNAPVVRENVSPISRSDITAKALEIAEKSDEVTKKDVISNITKFYTWRY
ncbi:MAG: hypothetical protein E7Z90_04235 [Cyanobacteria bacterium SIG29]|nr:hypothetical protein [Cyanobacteria bacterium SIG29]